MMTEDPPLPSAHTIDIRNAFVAPPVDDVEHAEQADGCIKTVLTGFVAAEPIFEQFGTEKTNSTSEKLL